MGNAGADQCRTGTRKTEERAAVVPALDISGANRYADIGAAAERVVGNDQGWTSATARVSAAPYSSTR